MPTQHYVHLFTGPDNLSHFKDVEVELDDRGAASFLSETMPATGINFRKNSMAYDLDWHPAPRRQFIINLTGAVKITASDGEVRVFGLGQHHAGGRHDRQGPPQSARGRRRARVVVHPHPVGPAAVDGAPDLTTPRGHCRGVFLCLGALQRAVDSSAACFVSSEYRM